MAVPERARFDDGHDPRFLVGRVGWPRSQADVMREWAVVQARVDRITLVPDRLRSDLRDAELAELGTWAAAAWTLGEVGAGPMTRAEQPLTWDKVQFEADLAMVLLRDRESGWEYATGVLCWIRWIGGAADTVMHPGW